MYENPLCFPLARRVATAGDRGICSHPDPNPRQRCARRVDLLAHLPPLFEQYGDRLQIVGWT